jgi:16S rRNA (adenine1518-N6/adenine1519-N6)-dimethyltransferase
MTGARRDAREALAAAGLRPRKRFGQHFLCDGGVAERIVRTADVGPRSVVLEIGPGLGALTDVLAGTAGRLYLVEIDTQLAARLVERYADNPRVGVVVGDVLDVPLDTLVTEPSVTVVANLPYNVAVPILFRLLDLRARFPRAVVMLQREVARRLVAPAGHADRGVTSVLMQTYADVRIAFGVSRRSFVPPPQVESAVVDVRWSAAPRVAVGDAAAWTEVVRAAFGQRRKMLHNALAGLATRRGLGAVALDAAFAAAGVDPKARAETLDLDAFARLARALEPAP